MFEIPLTLCTFSGILFVNKEEYLHTGLYEKLVNRVTVRRKT